MRNVFTTDELILLAYNETNKSDQQRLVKAMQDDETLRNEFRDIMNTKLKIDAEIKDPNKNAVQNLISYSRALDVIKTRQVGCINLLMN
jgi:hypothetical protein